MKLNLRERWKALPLWSKILLVVLVLAAVLGGGGSGRESSKPSRVEDRPSQAERRSSTPSTEAAPRPAPAPAPAPAPVPQASEPTVTVSDVTVAPGDTIVVSGSGFPAGEQAAVGIVYGDGLDESEPEILSALTVGPDGTFSADLRIPDSPRQTGIVAVLVVSESGAFDYTVIHISDDV